jgi:photosystem II stability/assembly factor-like uncharacterized protein
MSRVRVLVGTRKGAFILSAEGKRDRWEVGGPHFPGCAISDVAASAAQPSRLYAAQNTGEPGPQIHRSESGGLTWESLGVMPGPIASVVASPDVAGIVYAACDDGTLLRSTDSGESWDELPGPYAVGTGEALRPTIMLDPSSAERIYVASVVGAFRSNDGGASWRPLGEAGFDVQRLAVHAASPNLIYAQTPAGLMRSNDGGGTWNDVSGSLPSPFGYAVEVHAQEPETIYVVPMKSAAEDFPVDGKLRVYRSRAGGTKWDPLTTGLPQRDCYVSVARSALSADALEPCGLYFGTSGGAVYGSSDAGESWMPIVRDLPPVYSVKVQTLP